MKKRNVQYERCLVAYVDILGFKQKIDTESANHISRLSASLRRQLNLTASRRHFRKCRERTS